MTCRLSPCMRDAPGAQPPVCSVSSTIDRLMSAATAGWVSAISCAWPRYMSQPEPAKLMFR
ncbi:hypothetical protein J2S41_004159 [Catenuloplanes atrovinosus]|uniref:Uncharacterized protein n=1 Tax=Catenuloplanes atrovinosus TaxID=137266 RepID=A0AAE3YRL6_9ACTN|nr:hypothetical protein [Catenuloplanes atrovinosus]